jgi:hypothetical protein
MMSERLRSALGAFALTVMFAGPVIGMIAIVAIVAADSGGRLVGAALGNILSMVVMSILGGGAVRALVSIDARLEQRN